MVKNKTVESEDIVNSVRKMVIQRTNAFPWKKLKENSNKQKPE
jgi:hypothetical protein